MGGKELWIEEEERVEDLMYSLLGDCIAKYYKTSIDHAYVQFERLVEKFLKDRKPIQLEGYNGWFVSSYNLSSDQFDDEWFRERVNFLYEEYKTESRLSERLI